MFIVLLYYVNFDTDFSWWKLTRFLHIYTDHVFTDQLVHKSPTFEKKKNPHKLCYFIILILKKYTYYNHFILSLGRGKRMIKYNSHISKWLNQVTTYKQKLWVDSSPCVWVGLVHSEWSMFKVNDNFELQC